MPHTQILIDGKPAPSVTQIVGVMDKGEALMRWASSSAVRYIEERSVEVGGFLQLDKAVLKDAEKAYERIKEAKGKTGTAFHAAVDALMLANKDSEYELVYEKLNKDETLVHAVGTMEAWKKLVRPVRPDGYRKHSPSLPLEYEVKSKKHFYGGTLDAGLKVRDYGADSSGNKTANVLYDWKLTGNIYKTHPIQLAGYAQAFLEQDGVKFDYGSIIRPHELKIPAKESKITKIKDGYKYSFKGSKWHIEEHRFYGLYEEYLQQFLCCRETYDYLYSQGPWSGE